MACVILLILIVVIGFTVSKPCEWDRTKLGPKIYYINLDKSIQRRTEMNQQLDRMQVKYERFQALSMDSIYIPEDIMNTWNSKRAMYDTKELDYSQLSVIFPSGIGSSISAPSRGAQVIVTGLYGRRRTNRLAELGCTISHLLAMHKAIYSDLRPDGTHSESNYAIITEDDISYPCTYHISAVNHSLFLGNRAYATRYSEYTANPYIFYLYSLYNS